MDPQPIFALARRGSAGTSVCGAKVIALMAAWRLAVASMLGVLAMTGCASSARLALEGNFPKACRVARGEGLSEQQTFREQLFAKAAPTFSLALLDEAATVELQSLVGNRYPPPRFARIRIDVDERTGFRVAVALDRIEDRRAYYQIGVIDSYLGADLVYSRPEGALADLLTFARFAFQTSVNVTSMTICAVAHARPDCMGLWTESERQEIDRMVAAVDADPDMRGRKERLLAVAAQGDPLTVMVPNTSHPLDRPVVRLGFVMRSSFGDDEESCSYDQRIVVELAADDLDAAAASLSGGARPLAELHPRLE